MKSSQTWLTGAVLACVGSLSLLALTGCDSQASLSISSLKNPAPSNATLPNLERQGNNVILSWVTSTSEDTAGNTAATKTHQLSLSTFSESAGWSTTNTVAEGAHWFVNWADFPSVYAVNDTELAAHWLRRSGKSTYAYDVVTSQSSDGKAWSTAQTPHNDGTKTEHGFVSFFSVHGKPAAVWLDGRDTQPGGGHANHSDAQGSTGAMTLRTRVLSNFDTSSETMQTSDHTTARSIEKKPPSAKVTSTLLDDRVCDCCQTTAVNTAAGAVVFYRDRSDNEVRDIAYVRLDKATDTWSKPQRVFDDGWKINGCPVNGPQAAAEGRFVAVAWFTAAPSPRVQLAVSTDSGVTFSAPVVVSQSNSLGRVSVVLLGNNNLPAPEKNQILVSFLESSGADSAELKTTLFDENLSEIATSSIAMISAERRSGFPRMAALSSRKIIVAWTDWVDGNSSVHTAQIDVR